MEIRNINLDDMESLSKLYFQFWNEESDIQKMKEMFNRLKENDAYIFLCAEDENKLVGSVMGIICYELYGDCSPFLLVENMVVDKDFRKKGIGKMLFKELENQGKKLGCKQVLLITDTFRNDARAFYNSLGFDPKQHKGYKKKL